MHVRQRNVRNYQDVTHVLQCLEGAVARSLAGLHRRGLPAVAVCGQPHHVAGNQRDGGHADWDLLPWRAGG
jgi:hypothetical protein